MRDALGNKINDKDLIRWRIPAEILDHLVFQVIRTSDGGLSTPQGDTPPFVVLTVTVPINMEPGSRAGEPHLKDFYCLRNPESEKVIDNLIGGGKPS
jgi:hypothetical protein